VKIALFSAGYLAAGAATVVFFRRFHDEESTVTRGEWAIAAAIWPLCLAFVCWHEFRK
jgi:hypothetical protein